MLINTSFLIIKKYIYLFKYTNLIITLDIIIDNKIL